MKKVFCIEDLFTKNGNINNWIVNSIQFKKSKLYEEIIQRTKELDVFNGILFKDRLNYLKNNMKLSYCKKCNMPYIWFPKSQNGYRLCNHHNLSNQALDVAKNRYVKSKTALNQSLSDNRDLIMTEHQFNELNSQLLQKKPNYTFTTSNDTYRDYYHDLILKTSAILPYGFDNDFKLSERFFLLNHGMTSIPTCKFCGKKTNFKNRMIGYPDSCAECRDKKNVDTISAKIQLEIDDRIDKSRYEVINYPQLLNKDALTIRCRKCGAISNHMLYNGRIKYLNKQTKLCDKCEIVHSQFEEDIFEYLTKLDVGDIVHKNNSRKIIHPFEIDIYVEKHKLAIECDGLYWHSQENGKKRSYHLEKTELCESLGIHLIHVFEDEYSFKKDIVNSRIKDILGIYDHVIYARKCKVLEISNKESIEFQEKNHLQGAVNSKVRLGLFFNDELVSVMTFGKCRFDKKHEWEMLRFCSKLGYHVIGGASKLLKFFEREYRPKSLVSYADRRWSQGKLYKTLGFKLDHVSPPDYWYVKGKIRMNRCNFQKHRLKDILENFNPDQSEAQNMKDNGYCRIFDCGNLVFEKTY